MKLLLLDGRHLMGWVWGSVLRLRLEGGLLLQKLLALQLDDTLILSVGV